MKTHKKAPQSQPDEEHIIDSVRVSPNTGRLYITEKDLFANKGFRRSLSKAKALRDRKMAEAKKLDNR